MVEKMTPDVLENLKSGKVRSDDLFGDSKELIIIHDNQEYRMRITGNGKLILTK
ncbi:MAG: hemin uptake protein HemP [Sneathiellales bacterium]|nr:hemin uptake protein HemP [Sneathiellales bacterium]